MTVPIRTLNDGKQDQISAETGIDCSGDPDITRQEQTRDADLNILIPKFGGGQLIPVRPPIFGEIDFTDDLQRSLNAVREVNEAFNALPRELRARYPRWEDLLTAVQQGELVIKTGQPPAPPAPPAPVPPA